MPIKAIVYLVMVAIGLRATLSNPFTGIITFVWVTYIRPEVLSYGTLTQFRIPFIISLVLILATVYRGKLKILTLKNNTTLYFLIIMSMFMVMSTAGSIRPIEGYYWSWYMVRTVCFCYLIVLLTDTREKLFRLIYANVFAGGLLLLWGFQQHFLGNERLEDVGGGSTATSNDIAALCLLMMAYFLSLFSNSKLKNIFIILLISVSLMDIVFTQSRSALIAIIVMSGYLMFTYPSKYKYVLAIGGIFMFLIAASTTSIRDESYLDRIENLFEKKMEVDESASSRKFLWNAAIEVFHDNPLLGVGQQQFKYHTKDYSELHKNMIADAHNTFLLVLAEGGILTFTFYMLALLSFFYYTFRLNKIAKQRMDLQWVSKIAISLNAGMIGFIVTGIAHSFVTLEYYYWLLIMPCILLNVVEKESEEIKANICEV